MPPFNPDPESAEPAMPSMTDREAMGLVLESAGAGALEQAPILPPLFLSVLCAEIAAGVQHAQLSAEREFSL